MDTYFIDSELFNTIHRRWCNNTLSPNKVLNTKPGRQSGLYRVESNQQVVFIKQYYRRHAAERIKYLFKSTRAMAEVRNNGELHKLGIGVPNLLAHAEEKRHGFWLRSLLVLVALQNSVTLKQYSETPSNHESCKPLLKNLANDVAHLHNNGIYYRDLHAENILVSQDEARSPLIYFVDLHEARKRQALNKQQCVDDLARLNSFVTASVRTRIRFLLHYLQARNMPKQRQWLDQIDKRTREIWQRYATKHPGFKRKY